MNETQEPFHGGAGPSPAVPLLDMPITTTAVERLVTNILARPSTDADLLLATAEAVDEVIREAPSGSVSLRLRLLRNRLRERTDARANRTPGKAEAAALLRICPTTAASLRMWRAAMHVSCSAWSWRPILDALLAAAEEQELAGGRAG